MPLLINIMQATDLLSISRSKLYQLIRDGTIPVVRLGGRTLIEVGALRHIIDRTARRL